MREKERQWASGMGIAPCRSCLRPHLGNCGSGKKNGPVKIKLEGEFVAFEGQAFPMFDEKKHIMDPPVGIKWRREITGLDWGAIRPTAIVGAKVDSENRVWVTDEFNERRCTEAQMRDALGNGKS